MIDLVKLATSSNSNQQRKHAEQTLIKSRNQNPNQFFLEMIDAFVSTNIENNLRIQIGTVLSVSIISKTIQNQYNWTLINPQIKSKVKNATLSVLIDNQRQVRRSAGNIVSAICLIQLPRNQWEGIVEKICQNVSHENAVIKQSAILTLGMISSRLSQITNFSFQYQISNKILQAIMTGVIQNDQFMVDTSLKALRDSIPSLSKGFSNQSVRLQLLKLVGMIIPSDKFGVDGLQILGQFVKVCHSYLTPYIEGIYTLLDTPIKNTQNQESCVAAMQVWENIAQQAKQDNNTNYITGSFGVAIVTNLLKNLCVIQQGGQDNSICQSASKALQTIFQNGSIQYKQLVLNFVSNTIVSSDWKLKQASIRAFSLLLYGLPQNISQELINNSINNLFSLLNDPSIHVQLAALDSFGIITQISGKFILKSNNFIEYLKLITSKCSINQKFLRYGCRVIDNLCESDKEQSFGKFTPIANDLIEFFMGFSLKQESSLQIVSCSTTTIINIIQITRDNNVINKYLIFVLQNIDKIQSISDRQKRVHLRSAFFTIIQYCLHSLKNYMLPDSIIQQIYNKVINNFKKNTDVDADGFYAIEALVPYFGNNVSVVNDFWGYINHALNKWQDPVLFRALSSCISSFITYFGGYLQQQLHHFVPKMIELLEQNTFSKQLKLDVLVLLGQVFLICRQKAQPYLIKFLQMIIACCSAAIQLTETDFNYAQQLKDCIIQTLMCVVHGLNDQIKGKNQTFQAYIPRVFQFIRMSCDKSHKPTLSYVRRSVLLMADICKFYPNIVGPIKQQPFIHECINYLNTHRSNQNAQAVEYVKQFFN